MEEQRRKLRKAIGVVLNFRLKDDPNPMSEYAEGHRKFELSPEYFVAFREAFLTELGKLRPRVDDYDVDSWRAILDAGITYMNEPPPVVEDKLVQFGQHKSPCAVYNNGSALHV
jgi:hypothetical protein